MDEAPFIDRRITILFPAYYNPIWDLYLILKSGKRGGYAQSIILLCDALLESFLVRLVYDNNPEVKDVDQFFSKYCESNGLVGIYDAYSEISLVRNTIAHNHLWYIDLFTDFEKDEFIETPANKLYGHDNKKFKAYVDTEIKKTKNNGLSIIPDMLSLDDVNIVLKLVARIMREVYKVEREKGHHSIRPDATSVKYNNRMYSFPSLVDEFVELKKFQTQTNEFDDSAIQTYLESALENLYKANPDLNRFSKHTRQTEWNLAYHYANEVIKFFPGYDCDLDIIKPNLRNKRPDIIIHKRGNNKYNLLVIELKRNGSKRAITKDIAKIKNYWFSSFLKYKYGAVVNCYTDDRDDQVVSFKNE